MSFFLLIANQSTSYTGLQFDNWVWLAYQIELPDILGWLFLLDTVAISLNALHNPSTGKIFLFL
jgi:hypothetical protein